MHKKKEPHGIVVNVIKIVCRLILIHFKCRFYGGESIAKCYVAVFIATGTSHDTVKAPSSVSVGLEACLVLRNYESK